jgi:hypothetical protein
MACGLQRLVIGPVGVAAQALPEPISAYCGTGGTFVLACGIKAGAATKSGHDGRLDNGAEKPMPVLRKIHGSPNI